MALLNMVGEN